MSPAIDIFHGVVVDTIQFKHIGVIVIITIANKILFILLSRCLYCHKAIKKNRTVNDSI